MREIKFRAWQGGKFHYWGFIKSNYGDDYEFHAIADTNAEPLSMTEKMARSQQFTGLLDRQGKEIYEGDILSNEDYIDDAHCSFNLGNKAVEWNDECGCWIGIVGEVFEVIGNIYENPELLK